MVAEVERLGFRINNLTEAIHALSDHVTKQPQIQPLNNVTEGVAEAEELLNLSPAESAFSLDRSEQLQSKLLALGTSNGPPPDTDVSQEPVIATWKNALKSTHGRYEQVLAGLNADDEQLDAALNSWQHYVDSVEENMSSPFPASRDGLHEAARRCQVDRLILTSQNSVLNALYDQASLEDSTPKLKDLQGRLRALILGHRNTLVALTEREQLLYSTIDIWETYRAKVAQAQLWLLGLEQEKQGLQLRQVSHSRLGKMVSRLQTLLEELNKGEVQVEEVSTLCEQLTSSCDETIHSILKAEMNSLKQRVTNLRAGLETWLKYLNNTTALWNKQENLYNKLNSKLKVFQSGISQEIPTEFAEIQEQIVRHEGTIADLESLNPELTTFKNTREEMVGTLTPADLRIVTSRMWRLLQLQVELIHQYRMRINALEDNLELWQLYDTRYMQFMNWAHDMENKIDGGTGQYIDALIRKLEHEYQVEIGMKNIEMNWLISEGEELLKSCNEEQAKELKNNINTVEEVWKNILEKCKLKRQKLQDIGTTIAKTEQTLVDLKKWLFKIEKKLSSPVLFLTKSKKEIDRLLEEEEEMRKEIEKQSCNISSVLNLCEMVIRDCTEFDANGETDSLQEAYNYLEKRWGGICARSAERKLFIKNTKKLWEELFRVHNSFTNWLLAMEKKVGSISVRSTLVPYSDVQDILAHVHELQREIHDQTKEYEDLNQKYRVLARPHGRENRLDQANEIKKMVKEANTRFHILSYYASIIIRRLGYNWRKWDEFHCEKKSLIVWLNDLNAQLTEIEQQIPDGDTEAQQQALIGLLLQFEEQEERLESFDALVIYLYQRSSNPDCQNIEESLVDFQSTRMVVQGRLRQLKESFITEAEVLRRRRESQQMEEEEPVVDDDFSYSLVPDSELGSLDSAFDMNLVGRVVGGRSLAAELRAAIEESKKLIARLAEAIEAPTPPGIEVDKMYYNFVSILTHATVIR